MRRLFLEFVPELPVGTEVGLRHWLRSHPPRARFRGVVAEESGKIVGWSRGFFDWQSSEEAVGRAWVGVLPAHRGRGLGRTLGGEADAHLAAIGARSVESFARKGSEGEAFAERHGFVERRLDIFSSVDRREVTRTNSGRSRPGSGARGCGSRLSPSSATIPRRSTTSTSPREPIRRARTTWSCATASGWSGHSRRPI